MIHVNYVPRLLKNRNKKNISSFIQRMINGFIIFYYFFTALDLNTCQTTPYFFLILCSLSSLYYVKQHYHKFIYDIIYMTNNKNVQIIHKLSLWTREFFVQFLSSILGFWWIGDTYKCVPVDKIHQGYIWIIGVVFCFCIHIVHIKFISTKTERIVKQTYDHVDV